MGLAAVALGNESQAAGIIAHYGCGFVGRSAVHDNVFDVRIVLAQHALDGRADETPLVIGRGYDRDKRA